MTPDNATIVIIAAVILGIVVIGTIISWIVNPNGFKSAFKGFWRSVGQDLKSLFLKHWLRLLGGLVAYVLPLAFFLSAYLTRKPNNPSFTLPLAIWLVLIPLALLYWVRIRKSIDQKLGLMKAVNEIDASKHYASIIMAQALKGLMGFATWFIAYEIVRMSEEILNTASQGVLILGICYGVGAFLFVLDAVFTRAPTDIPIKIDRH